MIVPPRFDEPPDWDAIARFRSGESEGEEARQLTDWLAAHPEDAEMLDAMDAALARQLVARPPSSGDLDVDGALRAVRARMHGETTARVIPFPRRRATFAPRRSVVRWAVGGIATAAAIGALVVGVEPLRHGRERDRSVAAGDVIATAVGVRDSVRLPDGSRVILGPASRLTVSPRYGRDAREVTLDGAAWISVRHDRGNPFAVHAGPATVRDVGTEFTVRTDDLDGVGGGGVTVAVTEGVVELDPDHGAAASLTLRAGDRGEVRSDGAVVGMPGGAGEADLAWTRGQLVYRDAPLAVVRTDLRRWYGVELRVADSSLLAHRITASFSGEPVDRVLQVVALALGAVVQRQDSVAILQGGMAR